MRSRWGSIGLLWLLATPALADSGPAPPSAAVDLGTATLGRGEVALGVLQVRGGVTSWLTAGTFPAPWAITLVDPASHCANAFLKAQLWRRGPWSLSARAAAVWASLDDVDGDGLATRAWLLPSRVRAGYQIDRRWALAADVTWVYARLAANQLDETDTAVAGIAVASVGYAGVTVRHQLSDRLTLWGRGRLVFEHSPVIAEAEIRLSPSALVRARARAQAAELSAAAAATVGVLATRGRFNLRLGLGYGNWLVPMIELPVGRRLPSAELDAYWRF